MAQTDDIITLELGQYRLREQLAASAYGVVWRASGPYGSGDVALKLVNAPQMERALPGLRQRWIDSARAEIAFLQTLEPWDECHIVRLLDSGTHQGLPVQALELLGGDLGRYIAADGTPALAEALGWMRQLNQALAKVHQYGWRYLDLKPANVLVDPWLRRVKLADFGTSRRLASAGPHSYCGTAQWQAPEQFFPASGGGYATAVHSDYFALGALFYYMVTGGGALAYCAECGEAYRAHQADGAADVLARHGGVPATLRPADEANFTAALPRNAQEAALALLRCLLAADPAQRPRNALHISRMLDAISLPEGPCLRAA
ncbi:protein kinase domain-containing protein [Pseudoduganella sp. OTU4001]|uniref:protein kinase domain-containing protein n=1 Tax=Pseudoduganella sp. OTU4001 TaxID=3043854 RepID=UPI00313EB0EA